MIGVVLDRYHVAVDKPSAFDTSDGRAWIVDGDWQTSAERVHGAAGVVLHTHTWIAAPEGSRVAIRLRGVQQ